MVSVAHEVLDAADRWIDCGVPRLVTDEKYAAAMMCSRVGEPLVEDIIIPWKAFRVDLPSGLLVHDEYTYDHVLAAGFDGGDPGATLLLEGSRPGRAGEAEVVHVTRVLYGEPSPGETGPACGNLTELLLDRDTLDEVFEVPALDGITRPEMLDATPRHARADSRSG